jgi:hypothetical protein
MAFALQGNRSPVRNTSPMKYTVPVVQSKVQNFIKSSFSNSRKSKKSAKSRPTYGLAGTLKGQDSIFDAYV